MEKSKKGYIIIFLFSFVLTWLFAIFYFDKNEFDIEFRDKATTKALIFNFGSNEIVEELNDGRKVNVYDIEYLEYSYFVNGKKFKYGSENYKKGYSIGDEIVIEYVKSNPESSRIKGERKYYYNFFIRNLIMVSIFSFIIMFGVLYVMGMLKKSDRFTN